MVEMELRGRGVECSVCHEELSSTQQVLELPCGHLYHQRCLLPWIAQSGSCPNCRMALKGKGGVAGSPSSWAPSVPEAGAVREEESKGDRKSVV